MNLTHWGRVTHICVGKLTIIGSDNGLSPERRQVIIWTNAGILLIGPLGTNFSEILIEIQTFSLTKIRLKMSSAKWRLFGLGLNELSDMCSEASRLNNHSSHSVIWLVFFVMLCKHCMPAPKFLSFNPWLKRNNRLLHRLNRKNLQNLVPRAVRMIQC